MPSVTTAIADRLLDDTVDLMRLEAGQRRTVLRQLQQLQRDLLAALATQDPTQPARGAFQRARLERLLAEVTAILTRTYRAIDRTVDATLNRVAVQTAAATAQVVQAATGLDLLTAGLSQARLTALVDDLVLEGAPAREWWSRQAATTRQRWLDSMRQGQLLGESLSQLMQRTRRVVEVSMTSAERLVRTSLISTANTARQAVYEANSDVIQATEWLTTLDTRACPVCRALSGKAWTIPDRRPIGHRLPWPGVVAHWACRCVQVPVTKAFTELRQARSARLQRQLEALTAGQREALDGDLTADLTFDAWLRTRSAAQQRAILGPARYALWSNGRLRLDQMVSQDHRIFTIDELEARAA